MTGTRECRSLAWKVPEATASRSVAILSGWSGLRPCRRRPGARGRRTGRGFTATVAEALVRYVAPRSRTKHERMVPLVRVRGHDAPRPLRRHSSTPARPHRGGSGPMAKRRRPPRRRRDGGPAAARRPPPRRAPPSPGERFASLLVHAVTWELRLAAPSTDGDLVDRGPAEPLEHAREQDPLVRAAEPRPLHQPRGRSAAAAPISSRRR